ncbi:MAG: hypothetical protein M1825_000382 [Sarcosagium campestre]|nr:MAG: hypothetical protein M1825_000382 [Sarcosagium campestre]
MATPWTPATASFSINKMSGAPLEIPEIRTEEPFKDVVRKLYLYFLQAFDTPHTFEQLRTTSSGNALRPLVAYLCDDVYHPAIVSALLVVRWQFSELEPDDRGVCETRANACEIAAWRFVSTLSRREKVDYLLYELPDPSAESDENNGHADEEEGHTNGHSSSSEREEHNNGNSETAATERTSLLNKDGRSTARRRPYIHEAQNSFSQVGSWNAEVPDNCPTTSFVGLNALEIAAVADAKKFLSQDSVQKIINGIWRGDIVFWESLSVHAKKKAHFYNKRSSSLCREGDNHDEAHNVLGLQIHTAG